MVGDHLSGERFDFGQGCLFQGNARTVVLEQALLCRLFDEGVDGVCMAWLDAHSQDRKADRGE
ncbi:hypothetical protein [Pseudomonas viridiflava]|uniref:hypothetical protein n=1 Tax=Pseudomonas atacamensis TaxID=2565368 RepID=UPI001F11E6FA